VLGTLDAYVGAAAAVPIPDDRAVGASGVALTVSAAPLVLLLRR
jgi:hypothetical protein